MRARDLGVQASPTCLRGEATHQRETTPRSGHALNPKLANPMPCSSIGFACALGAPRCVCF